MTEKTISAFEFAAKWHGGQKYGKYGFLYHLAQVAQNAMEHGYDGNVIVAAILHDVIEDTECPPVDIGEEFGTDIMLMVAQVTRCQHETTDDYYGKMSGRAMLVKVSDRLANLDNIGFNDTKTDRWLFEKVLPKYEGELGYYRDFPEVRRAVKRATERKLKFNEEKSK